MSTAKTGRTTIVTETVTVGCGPPSGDVSTISSRRTITTTETVAGGCAPPSDHHSGTAITKLSTAVSDENTSPKSNTTPAHATTSYSYPQSMLDTTYSNTRTNFPDITAFNISTYTETCYTWTYNFSDTLGPNGGRLVTACDGKTHIQAIAGRALWQAAPIPEFLATATEIHNKTAPLTDLSSAASGFPRYKDSYPTPTMDSSSRHTTSHSVHQPQHTYVLAANVPNQRQVLGTWKWNPARTGQLIAWMILILIVVGARWMRRHHLGPYRVHRHGGNRMEDMESKGSDNEEGEIRDHAKLA